MYGLTPIQIEEDARDAKDAANHLSREEYYFWHRTDADGAEAEAYHRSLIAEQAAELAAFKEYQAEMNEAWWEAISRNDR